MLNFFLDLTSVTSNNCLFCCFQFRDKQQLMLFCHSLHHQLPDDISINPPQLPLNQMEESIAHSIQSMKQEVTTHVTGLQTLQKKSMLQGQDNEEIMEVEQTEEPEVTEVGKVSEIRRKFKMEHLKMLNNETVVVNKEDVRHVELCTSECQQRTDMSVRTLAKNISKR